MKPMTLTYVTILVGALAALVDKNARHDPYCQQNSEPRITPTDTESRIDNWVEYAMPGKNHQLLEQMAGQWSLVVKYRMNSQTPVVESEGTCERHWILGNRFLLEEFDGGALGLPFKGLAIYGYDSFAKKYTCVWLDTMSTAITSNLGTCQNGCTQINFVGQHGDPWTGTMRPSRGTTRFIAPNRHVLELHEPDTGGKEFKILEIIYTRK